MIPQELQQLATQQNEVPVVSIQNVEKRYGKFTALSKMSLDIQPGAHILILGPNGAGKTTLLELLGAERHPTTGSVTVLGGRLGRVDLRDLRARIGVAGQRVAERLPPQATALEVVLTGRDGTLAPWWTRGDGGGREAALELLSRLGCGHLADRALGATSQGERQRVLIARSLYGRHRLLLLDEPAAGVDLPGREALVAALDALAAAPDAPATVHVAHTLEELPASTSHAALLRAGRLVAEGPVAEVLTEGHLSECYGLEVRVERRSGRWQATAAPSW